MSSQRSTVDVGHAIPNLQGDVTRAATFTRLAVAITLVCGLSIGCGSSDTGELNDEQVENLVRRSYQYVAMYSVKNKFAQVQGGWNTSAADTRLNRR
jgi:hypothetical protein